MPTVPVLDFWYKALHSRSGICIRVTDLDKTRQALYRARKDAMDPRLDCLQISASPTATDELWIVHARAQEPTDAEET